METTMRSPMKTNGQSDADLLLKSKIPGKATGIEVKKTVCGICNPLTHCGIDAYVKDGVVVKIEGSRDNPHSEGTLCPKGAANRQFIYHPDRILTPRLRTKGKGSEGFQSISWDQAFEVIGERLLKIRDESGPESIVFFTGYTKWYRPFLQRLAHAFGSPNYCSESSCCFYATKMAFELNYGKIGEPDIANAKCLLAWSGNPFHSFTPVARHLVAARENGLKIIDVGPLITPLTAHADIHLRIRPGTSGALALGMAHVIIREGLHDVEFLQNWTHGFEDYRAYVAEFTPELTERITDVPADRIVSAARLYATSKPSAMMFSANAVVHHTNGVQNQRAAAALIGLTGNWDRKGGNHIISPSYYHVFAGIPDRYEEFAHPRPWKEMAPRVGEDVHPVFCRLIDEAQSMHIPFQIRSQKPYPIRAVVGFGMNYRMWPGSDFMAESLKKLDFFMDVDLFMTDTARMADLVLPACTSFERSELKIYPQQYMVWTEPVIRPLGESRPDTDIIQGMAKSLRVDDSLLLEGHKAWIDWILEPAGVRMSELEKNPGKYLFKGKGSSPYEKYKTGGFPTPSGKMEFSSTILKESGVDPLPTFKEPGLSRASTPEVAEAFPLTLTTGARLPMFVHSQTFRLPWIQKLRPDHPMADIHPKDARERGIQQGDRMFLITPRSSVRVKANLTEMVPPGVVSMYHAYPTADVNLLIEPDYRDPISGFPGFKSLLCEIKKAVD
jgi:anaerobic selenocysteine-containing dehydrogenase